MKIYFKRIAFYSKYITLDESESHLVREFSPAQNIDHLIKKKKEKTSVSLVDHLFLPISCPDEAYIKSNIFIHKELFSKYFTWLEEARANALQAEVDELREANEGKPVPKTSEENNGQSLLGRGNRVNDVIRKNEVRYYEYI